MKLNRNVLGLLKGCEAQLPASGLEHNVVCARDEGLPLPRGLGGNKKTVDNLCNLMRWYRLVSFLFRRIGLQSVGTSAAQAGKASPAHKVHSGSSCMPLPLGNRNMPVQV